jgi:hypothetical protein
MPLNKFHLVDFLWQFRRAPRRLSFHLSGQAATLLFILPFLLQIFSRADTAALNVTNFGATGDAVQILASTVSNSATVILDPGNALSSADVGKIMELFGAGGVASGTNHQDLAGFIIAVTNGTNVTLSRTAGLTASGAPCTIGTQNAGAFQQCVDACQGTNTAVLIPAGSYLLVPPSFLDPSFVMDSAATLTFAIHIRKGGIHLLGAQGGGSRLLGNGAWALKGAYVQRGALVGCIGPVTNDAPLLFENLTMDGGVQVGNQGNIAAPASVTDGSGWDVTHAAVVDFGQAPLHAYKGFINCRFVHWRGEMVKSVVGGMDGLIQMTNCAFVDGQASGFNFNFTHEINGCLFSNLFMAMEFYEGYMQGASTFENSTMTNLVNAIVLVGALTNHVEPPYTIRSNIFGVSGKSILFSPVRNLTVIGNQFFGSVIGLGSDDYAYQGTDYNSDILVENNTFTGTGYCLNIASSGPDRVANMTWLTNTAVGCPRFGNGYGWSTNIVFLGNASLPQNGRQGLLFGTLLTGQYFIDDASNQFPTNYVGVYGSTLTNTVTYALGMRWGLWAEISNGVFLMDTSQPNSIPTNALLTMSYGSQFPATLYLASQPPFGAPIVLNPGDLIACQWTGGQWIIRTQPAAPTGLHILGR